MKKLLTLLPLIMFSSVISAQEEESEMRWYTTEIIIFSNTSTAGIQEEYWPDDPGVPDTENSVTLITGIDEEETLIPAGQPIEFQELPLDTLADSLATMQRSSRYKILLATAWRLPGLPKGSAPPVLIKAGKRYLPDGSVAPPLPEVQMLEPNLTYVAANILNEDDSSVETLHPEENIKYELEGRIGISLSRYLDVDTDLLYRTTISLPDENNIFIEQFQDFRLTEYRRMKSKTIHMLDHPMFGMLIAINRYELPQLEEGLNTDQSSAGVVTNQALSTVQ